MPFLFLISQVKIQWEPLTISGCIVKHNENTAMHVYVINETFSSYFEVM